MSVVDKIDIIKTTFLILRVTHLYIFLLQQKISTILIFETILLRHFTKHIDFIIKPLYYCLSFSYHCHFFTTNESK